MFAIIINNEKLFCLNCILKIKDQGFTIEPQIILESDDPRLNRFVFDDNYYCDNCDRQIEHIT